MGCLRMHYTLEVTRIMSTFQNLNHVESTQTGTVE